LRFKAYLKQTDGLISSVCKNDQCREAFILMRDLQAYYG